MIGEEDLLLYMLGNPVEKTIKVYWGADPSLLKPMQVPNVINILVDHQYYGSTRSVIQRDLTKTIIESLLVYQKKCPQLVIKHIGNGRVNIVNDSYVMDRFVRSRSMDFREIYKYYNEANIYVVTHPESLGYSTIECGCSGALVVQPAGYINSEILDNLHHYTIEDSQNIDWESIIKKIDVSKSVSLASVFNYKNLANVFYEYVKNDYYSSDK
jgi:hypothetical protein